MKVFRFGLELFDTPYLFFTSAILRPVKAQFCNQLLELIKQRASSMPVQPPQLRDQMAIRLRG
jgi:hypothetical protein